MLWAFRDRILDLKKDRRFKYILLFKNHGEAAGASLEHSHSQLIALPILPIYVVEELQGAKQYYIYKERCVFCDTIRQEIESGIRVVAENEDFLTLAPYAPRFPFETWILPKRHESAFENSSSQMFENLAKALKLLLMKADRVLDNPPYNLVIHTSPAQDPTNEYYHWHIEFMPKLTKTAGFEWGTGFYINPTPPEEAAKFLREASVEDVAPRRWACGRAKMQTARAWNRIVQGRAKCSAFLMRISVPALDQPIHERLYPGVPLSLGAVENFGVPRHLNRFQLGFVRLRGIVFEAGERESRTCAGR